MAEGQAEHDGQKGALEVPHLEYVLRTIDFTRREGPVWKAWCKDGERAYLLLP